MSEFLKQQQRQREVEARRLENEAERDCESMVSEFERSGSDGSSGIEVAYERGMKYGRQIGALVGDI